MENVLIPHNPLAANDPFERMKLCFAANIESEKIKECADIRQIRLGKNLSTHGALKVLGSSSNNVLGDMLYIGTPFGLVSIEAPTAKGTGFFINGAYEVLSSILGVREGTHLHGADEHVFIRIFGDGKNMPNVQQSLTNLVNAVKAFRPNQQQPNAVL